MFQQGVLKFVQADLTFRKFDKNSTDFYNLAFPVVFCFYMLGAFNHICY